MIRSKISVKLKSFLVIKFPIERTVMQKRQEKTSAWKFKVRCTGYGNGGIGCGKEFLVGPEQISATYVDDTIRIGTTFNITTRCPHCGRLTDIPSKEVPEEIRFKAVSNLRGMERLEIKEIKKVFRKGWWSFQ